MQYLSEIENYIDIIEKYEKVPKYFLNILRDVKQENAEKTPMKVGIIGDEFYGLYVRSYGLTPVFLNGGSYLMGENASHIFPQISDPIAKSAVGLLLDEEAGLAKELGAVIICASNDSFKKAITYLKDLDLQIIQVEPPSFTAEKMPMNFMFKQIALLNSISKLANTTLDSAILKNEISGYQKAYALMQSESWNSLPTFVRSFFIQTLHIDEDKHFWIDEMQKFLDKRSKAKPKYDSLLLLTGSKIQMPNSKLHEVLFEVGISYYHDSCLGLADFSKLSLKTSAINLIRNCFSVQYRHFSVMNSQNMMNNYDIPENTSAIIFYLLKGQTSDAYQAERMEEFAIKENIPFLCIETDYTDTDKEQVKIRIEAFYEMLSGKLSKKTNLVAV